jgi:hypothetical protein
MNRSLRAVANLSGSLRTKLDPGFVEPSYEMGIRGRCVVLRKLGEDDRDSQANSMRPF